MTAFDSAQRVAIVAIDWHTRVCDGLISNASESLKLAGVPFDVFRVPSAFDLPLVVDELLSSHWVGAIALGAIIRGSTDRHMYLAQSVTTRLGEISLGQKKPIGFGVLFVATEEEALDRAGFFASSENRGAEAAKSVVDTLRLIQTIRESSPRLRPMSLARRASQLHRRGLNSR